MTGLSTGRRRRRLASKALLGLAAAGLAAAILPAIASSTVPTISAYNEPGVYGAHYWMPSTETIGPGGAVRFTNPYTTTYHGLKFTGGPEQPSCPTIPAAAEGPSGAFNWEGECTFTKPGAYTFICTVHPTEMTGTITVPGTPTAKTMAASGETQTEATLGGAIEPAGNATDYHFEYGTASVSENTTAATSLGAADFTSHSVSAPLTGLSPGTTYHFELVAVYGAGTTVHGGEQTFTTPVATAPTATTTAVSALKAGEATLKGSVDPEGGAKAEYFFEWGLGPSGPSYEHTTPAVSLPADGAQHPASAVLTGLASATQYHFRLVAENALGSAHGEDLAFTTSAAPPPPPQSEPPPSGGQTGGSPPPTVTPISLSSGLEEAVAPLVAGSLKLKTPAHGSSVRGSIEVSSFGAGGRLEVDLLAKSVSSARHRRSTQVLAGRASRGSVPAGKAAFAVGLNARFKRVLRRHRSLPVTVRIVFTPPTGKPMTLAKHVVVRA